MWNNSIEECLGPSICPHERQRSRCGGSSICEHDCRKSRCKECGGSQICEHDRIRSQCKECLGGSICQHVPTARRQRFALASADSFRAPLVSCFFGLSPSPVGGYAVGPSQNMAKWALLLKAVQASSFLVWVLTREPPAQVLAELKGRVERREALVAVAVVLLAIGQVCKNACQAGTSSRGSAVGSVTTLPKKPADARMRASPDSQGRVLPRPGRGRHLLRRQVWQEDPLVHNLALWRALFHTSPSGMCVCMCVCVRERVSERARDWSGGLRE